MYRYILIFICFSILTSCKSNKKEEKQEENIEAKEMIQGIWLDESTDAPFLRIKNDSIFYSNSTGSPVSFKIIGDTLYTYGMKTDAYKIEKISQYNLWLKVITDDILKLIKADNQSDLSSFITTKAAQGINEVIKKDSVIISDKKRYRGYVYINPSKMKIAHSGISNEGISVDNIYYDNIIHICVYEGKNKICSKDIYKSMFKDIIPNEFLQYAILSDMDFVGVNSKGFLYEGTICIPDNASCYMVNVLIDKNSNLNLNLAD